MTPSAPRRRQGDRASRRVISPIMAHVTMTWSGMTWSGMTWDGTWHDSRDHGLACSCDHGSGSGSGSGVGVGVAWGVGARTLVVAGLVRTSVAARTVHRQSRRALEHPDQGHHVDAAMPVGFAYAVQGYPRRAG